MDKIRCPWCEKDDLYRNYHDYEWGKPVKEDAVFFEFIILESFQAGLSWHTILKKRENFRFRFDDFNPEKIADYTDEKVESLMKNPGIIRNRLKILAAITNAKCFLHIQEEFGSFSNYIWEFVGYAPIINQPETAEDVPASTEISDAISNDLKKRGFKFMGSIVVYALMQSCGLVNDHLNKCDFKTS